MNCPLPSPFEPKLNWKSPSESNTCHDQVESDFISSTNTSDLPHLNAVVVEIGDDDMPLRVDGDVVRPGQVVRLAAPRPELGEELPVELKEAFIIIKSFISH